MEITPENREKAIALLREGICPICGKRYKEPLLHISKAHGISKNEVKDILLINHLQGFTTPELQNEYSVKAKKTKFWVSSGAQESKKGSKQTIASKEKMRKAVKERYKERPDLLQKFKQGQKKSCKDAAKKSGEVTKKEVARIDPATGEVKIYNSVTEAAKDNGLNSGNISRAARGVYKMSGGYKWRYMEGHNGEGKY